MRKYLMLVLAFSLVCGTATVSLAAKKAPKPAPKKLSKPAPKKPAKSAPKPVQVKSGTVQLPGGPGGFGTVYSLRKDGPLYFRLVKAEYTTEQVVIGDGLISPAANEKLLVLHFTVQNPQKSEQFVRWDSLSFTAVDTTNANHEGKEDWGDDVESKPFAMSMKPAQTTALYTVLRVPAKGIIPKLMVLPGGGDGPVLRYDLTDPMNKVAPLKAPIADPADPSGYTALETVRGAVGTAYPYAFLDITVEKFDYVTGPLGDETPDEGGRLLVVTLLLKNRAPSEQFVRWDCITPTVTTTDSEDLSSYKDMFLATASRSLAQNIKAGAEIRVRCLFAIPKDCTPKTLSLKQGDSRTYQFEVH